VTALLIFNIVTEFERNFKSSGEYVVNWRYFIALFCNLKILSVNLGLVL